MVFADLLNRKFKCDCGREHIIPINEIIIEEKVLEKMPAILKKIASSKTINLIFDRRTFTAAGNELSGILQVNGYIVKKVMFKEEKVAPDPVSLFKILEAVDKDGYIIACGSGTINDLTAYIAHKLDKPYLVVATAPSMDGYASSVATLTIEGIKTSYKITPPGVIVADLAILKKAPRELIQSGIGDLVGKVTSLLDWQLSNILFQEFYCQRAVDLVKDQLDKLLCNRQGLKKRTSESIKILMTGLISSGLAMYMAGSSRPASGSEHQFSHFLDLYHYLYQRHVPNHGLKVALGTYFSASLYLKLLDCDFSQLKVMDKLEQETEDIDRIYKSRAEMIKKNLQLRRKRQRLTPEILVKKEDKIKKCIYRSKSALKKSKILIEETGIMERDDIKQLRNDWVEHALKYGFEIRKRYTIFTFLKEVGLLESWTEELLSELKKSSIK